MHACGKNKKSKVSVKSEFYENVMFISLWNRHALIEELRFSSLTYGLED